jgi:protein-L-isoaspartate O-methyltransferase
VKTSGPKSLTGHVYPILLVTVVFSGSFLLFVSEPLIGRLLLPFLGGAIHIWLVCLMFFQGMLLLGYLYAHLVAGRIGSGHLLLLFLPLINLPFSAHAEPNPHTPILSLVVVLISRFSLTFVILSTTVVVVQSWLSRSKVGQYYEPYSLYAASNAGSLVGLLGYAFIIEPLMGIRLQSIAWAIGYFGFVFLMFITWYCLKRDRTKESAKDMEKGEEISERAPHFSSYGAWILLSSLPSAFLLAVSNFISMEVGSFPLIWVLPLSAYLGSFIVTFRAGGGVPRILNLIWPEMLLLAAAFYFIGSGSVVAILGCLLTFSIICIVAHGRLYEMRPATKWLTNYYLATALGGFLGGVSIGLAVPFMFNRYYEYLILLLIFGIVFWWLRGESLEGVWTRLPRVVVIGRVLFLTVVLVHIALSALPISQEAVKFRHRNFYGTYRIYDFIPRDDPRGGIRILQHGKTLHGAQMLDSSSEMIPVYYYYRGGGFSDVFETTPKPSQTAVIGLGAGVISVFAEPRDTVVFFEIDPDNHRIAKQWFTYLDRCKGKVSVINGDGRLSLRNYGKDGGRFDIIIVDAFSGDAIPVHLLTREAIELYLSRLKEDGIVLFHISSRYYHLYPVVKSTIADLNLAGVMNVLIRPQKLGRYQLFPNLVAVAKNPERLKPLINRGWFRFSEKDGLPKLRPWTDDYIDIITPLMMTVKNVGLFHFGHSN